MNQKQKKINQIMDFTKSNPESTKNIPISWWINNPQGVADRLNAYAKKMGLKQRFTADEVGRKIKES